MFLAGAAGAVAAVRVGVGLDSPGDSIINPLYPWRCPQVCCLANSLDMSVTTEASQEDVAFLKDQGQRLAVRLAWLKNVC